MATFFMMVSLPEDATAAVCFSILRVSLADNSFFFAACATRARFLGGIVRCPFLGFEACFVTRFGADFANLEDP